MTRTFLTTALLCTGATLLIAAGPRADLDNDGQVTKTEFTATALQAFTSADTNGDGFLTAEERKSLREAKRDDRGADQFDKIDADGDGNITRAEMEASRAARDAKKTERREAMKAEMLERYDTNVDGELSEAERLVARAERDATRSARKSERTERRAERPKPDANGDGFISQDEHMAMAEQLFTRMDANGDGVLTQGEGRKRKGKRDRKGDESRDR